MKTWILLPLISLVVAQSSLSKDFESAKTLSQLWENEEIYFLPKNKDALMNWTGVIYHQASQECYELNQKDDVSNVTSKKIVCAPTLLKKAKEPYAEIPDFEVYKSRLLKCLEQMDKACLRGLISKTLKLSFGMDGLQDRRDTIFENWNQKDFKRLRDSLKKGTIGSGNSRTFPPEVSDEGMGYRGEFQKMKGTWLLKSFLAGD